MSKAIDTKQLDVYEVRTDDGGVGIELGDMVYMGYDKRDVTSILKAIFEGTDTELRRAAMRHTFA